MKSEHRHFLGTQMQVKVNRNMVTTINDKQRLELFEGDIVTIKSFSIEESNDHTLRFNAETKKGDSIILDHYSVDLTHIPIDIDKLDEKDIKVVQSIHDLKQGHKYITLHSDTSEIGVGLLVDFVDLDDVYTEKDALVVVKNQWGGIEIIGLSELAHYDKDNEMTNQDAIDILIETLSAATITDNNKEKVEKAISKIKLIRDFI